MNKAAEAPIPPNIYGYYDYRAYLKALFEYHKAVVPVFSHRYIVQKAGFSSPTTLKNVILGKRNLTPAATDKFARAFKLKPNERRYFLALVLFTQAPTLLDREKHLKELTDIKWVMEPALIPQNQFEVLSKWWHLVIKEIAQLPDFLNSSKWVANCILPGIDPKEAGASLKLLKRLGLIVKKQSKWEAVDKIMITDDRVRSVMLAQYHREMIRLGSEAISRFQPEEREINGTTVRLGKGEVAAIKTLLREFQLKVLNIAAHSLEFDQVYQLNFQFFPMARTVRPKRLKKSAQ